MHPQSPLTEKLNISIRVSIKGIDPTEALYHERTIGVKMKMERKERELNRIHLHKNLMNFNIDIQKTKCYHVAIPRNDKGYGGEKHVNQNGGLGGLCVLYKT